jgi:ribokinase
MYDFITFGSATRDVFIRSQSLETHSSNHSETGVECCFPMGSKIEISDLALETGGGGSNSAVTFSRLGYRTATVTCIGNDPSGRDIMDVLKANGIVTEFVQRHPLAQTAFSIVTVVGSGERTVMIYRGAAEKIAPMAIPWSKVKAKWFYVTSLAGNLNLMGEILDHAERNGIKAAWNPGSKELKLGLKEIAPLVKKVDVFNLNLEEAMSLVGTSDRDVRKLIAELKGLPRRALIITDGMNGAYAAADGKIWHSGTVDVPRVNVTGAGDAFGSGFVAGLFKNDDIPFALCAGTWNATCVVQQTGAKRGIISVYPNPEECARVKLEEIKP